MSLEYKDLVCEFEKLKEYCKIRTNSVHSLVSGNTNKFTDLADSLKKSTDSIYQSINEEKKERNEALKGLKNEFEIKGSYFLTVHDFDLFRSRVDEWMAQIKSMFELQQTKFSEKITSTKSSIEESIFDLEKLVQVHFDSIFEKIKENDHFPSCKIEGDNKHIDKI